MRKVIFAAKVVGALGTLAKLGLTSRRRNRERLAAAETATKPDSTIVEWVQLERVKERVAKHAERVTERAKATRLATIKELLHRQHLLRESATYLDRSDLSYDLQIHTNRRSMKDINRRLSRLLEEDVRDLTNTK